MSARTAPTSAAAEARPRWAPRSWRGPWDRPARWALGASVALLALFLLPARGAALRGDDEWSFAFAGQLELSHRALIPDVISKISGSLSHWRPQVLGDISSYLTIYVFNGHPSEYRLYLVALTAVAGCLLGLLVRRLGGPALLAALAVLLFAGAVQFRSYHDPMLGYYGDTQFALIFVLASLLAMLRALQHGGRRWMVASVVLFACACAMQEYVYPLAATHLGLAFTQRRGRQAIWAASPVIGISLILMAVGYIGRSGAAVVDSGYGTSLSPHAVLASYITQLFPPIPGSYRLFYQGVTSYYYAPGSSPTPAEFFAGVWRGVVVFAGVMGLVLWLRRRGGVEQEVASWHTVPGAGGASRTAPSGMSGRLLGVGIPLWLAPPLLIAVSGKYQAELTPGKGYVEVLLQSAGFALVAAAGLLGLLRAAERRSPAALLAAGLAAAALLGLGAGVDGFNNIRVVALEQPVRHTRDLLETAAHRGVFADVPQRSTLLFSGDDMVWPTGSWAYGTDTGENVLYADSGRNFDVRFAPDVPTLEPLNCGAVQTFPPPACAPPERSAAWVRVRARAGGGVVTVSQMTDTTVGNMKKQTSASIYVYTETSGDSVPRRPLLTGTLPGGRPWSPDSASWTRVRDGSGWAIYHATVRVDATPVAFSITYPDSPVNFLAPITSDQDVRMFGASGLLP